MQRPGYAGAVTLLIERTKTPRTRANVIDTTARLIASVNLEVIVARLTYAASRGERRRRCCCSSNSPAYRGTSKACSQSISVGKLATIWRASRRSRVRRCNSVFSSIGPPCFPFWAKWTARSFLLWRSHGASEILNDCCRVATGTCGIPGQYANRSSVIEPILGHAA
jgi:hypothetical protein